jgi:hypothetical protein
MRPLEAARRLTGISTPFGGVSFAPPTESERAAAHHVITFLEDRRVLYNPLELDSGRDHVLASVQEIRRELIRVARDHDRENALGSALRAMAAACRKFLDEATVARYREIPVMGQQTFFHPNIPIIWNSALGELRGVMGIHIAELASHYDVDVADELAVILPAEVGDDEVNLDETLRGLHDDSGNWA